MISNTIRFNVVLLGITALIFSSWTFVAHAQMMGSFGDLDIDLDGDSVDVSGTGFDVDIDGDDVDVDLPGVDVDVDDDGVNVNAGGTKVNTTGNKTQVSAGDVDVSVDDDGVDVSTPGASVKTGNNGTEVNAYGTQVQSSGSGTQIRTTAANGETLRVMASEGGVDVQTRNALLSFDGDTVVEYIQDDADLDIYVNMLDDEYDTIDDISVKGNSVSMTYSQPAKLFGLFNMNFDAEVEVNGDDVAVKLPWYSFLASKPGLAQLKKTITSQVKGASYSITDSSVTTEQATVIKTAGILNVTTQAIDDVYTNVMIADDGVSVKTGDTSVTAGDDGVHVDAGGTTVDIDDSGAVNVNY